MPDQLCTQCGSPIKPDSKFCTACGAKAGPPASSGQPKDTQTGSFSAGKSAAMSAAGALLGNTALASASGGEMAFTQVLPSAGGLLPDIGLSPLKYLLGGAGRLFKGFPAVFRDKKRLIPAAVLAVVWLLLMVLPILGIDASVFGFLSFLTFAQGGTSGGLIGIAGGIAGKGLFAYFISALMLPLFSGGKPFAGIGGGFKILIGSFAVKDTKAVSSMLAGTGAALAACNFLTGDASIQNSMAGIIAFIVSLRALSSKAGFLRGLLMSFANKYTKGKTPDTSIINGIIAGWAAGFALSVPLSATGISIICYLAGVLAIFAAIVFAVLSKKSKGAAV